MDVVQIAQVYREQWDYVGKGGVVVVYEGVAQGWMNRLRNPEHWRPDCVAVDEDGRTWTTIAGNDSSGALMWLPSTPVSE